MRLVKLVTCSLVCLMPLSAVDLTSNPLKFTVDTTRPGTTSDRDFKVITIPGETYDYAILCKDGDSNPHTDTGDHICAYSTPGTYTISIWGTFPGFGYNGNNKEVKKFVSIDQWGDIVWKSMASAFEGAQSINIAATDSPNLSQVTDMSRMFYGVATLSGNFQNWDVSHVTNMKEMFSETDFNESIGNWNVSSVTNMASMFGGDQAFNQDISNWNVSNVTNMVLMFRDASAFNQPIGNWDVSRVTTMEGMFEGVISFNQDIGSWNVSNVTNMAGMFYWAKAFNQDIGDWKVSRVTTMEGMFYGAESFNQPIGNWDVSKVTDMEEMFSRAGAFNQDISDWNVSSVTNMTSMFSRAEEFNQDISSWDVSKVTGMGEMFNRAGAFNQDIGSWDVSNVTDMYRMFYLANNFSQDLRNWNVSQVTNMTYMFDESGLSTSHYDALLQGWQQQSLQPNVRFDNRYGYYCKAEDARQAIIDTYNWTFDDSGKDCSYYITSSERFSVKAGNKEVGTVTVNDPNADTTFSLITDSADGALFEIDAVTGTLRFKQPVSYKGSGDNLYHVLVKATSESIYKEDIQTIRVTVEPNPAAIVPVIGYLLN